MAEISVPEPVESVYDGTMTAKVFGVIDDPDAAPQTNVIETTQAWGVQADWEFHGELFMMNLAMEFRLHLNIESFGPGPEVKLPVADVVVPTLSVPLTSLGGGRFQRKYTAKLNIPALSLPAGTYRVVTVLQLAAIGGTPMYSVAGLIEEPLVQIIKVP